MKNMEKGKFEDLWKNAFDNGEVDPSDSVWTNVELDLEKAKGRHLKRRLMFFQMLAAASIIFSIGIGVFSFYFVNNQKDAETILSQNALLEKPARLSFSSESNSYTDSIAEVAVEPKTIKVPPVTSQINSKKQHSLSSGIPLLADRKNNFAKNILEDQEDFSGDPGYVKKDIIFRELFNNSGILTPIYTPRQIEPDILKHNEEVDPVVAMLTRLEEREKEVGGERKNKDHETSKSENLWTSVGIAAGSFTTMHASVSPTSSNATLASNATIVDQEAKASGYSYSMGVQVGTKLSNRWVIQGGFNYLSHSSDYTAHNMVVSSQNYQSIRPASTNELVKADIENLTDEIVNTAPYNINNNLRYLSIPMQAGYMVVNKSFGMQFNAGVATDLFLQNSVKADGGDLGKTTQSGGADSPYRSVNLSGLLGTELSYRFSTHYRIALNPGIRYPLNTIYKSDLGVQSSPLTFDMGLRFRYIFH